MARTRSPLPQNAITASKIAFPDAADQLAGWAPLTLHIAEVADEITRWGDDVKRRDEQLREFFITENMLAGAVYSVCARNSAFEWVLDGPEALLPPIEYMLNNAITYGGFGWVNFVNAISLDIQTQDNGFVMEIIRKSPTDPVRGIAHLDANRCQRTGDPKFPIIYTDREDKLHKLPWYNVVAQAELPSAIETMNGVGYCAVTRVLRSAQILRDLAQYKHEKVSGRFFRAIHFVGGVARGEIDDVMKREQERSDNAGLIRYMMPAIVASLDPEKPVSTATIELASLPDNFDLDQELKWYIASLALGFGVDYQDFAPLPGGNLGTSAQSEVLHKKSRGKGPALFMKMLQDLMHWRGVLPKSVTFKFSEQDLDTELDEAKLRKTRAEERQIRIESGEITPEVARRIAVDCGDLEEEYEGMIDPEYNPMLEEIQNAQMGFGNVNEPPPQQKKWWIFRRGNEN